MTTEARQAVIDAHIDDHGSFDLNHFVSVVAADPDHPAHGAICPDGWRDRAERSYLVELGRQFIRKLRLEVTIEIKEAAPMTILVPSLVADMRQPYVQQQTRYVTPEAPNYMDVLDARAAKELSEWAEKYRAVIVNPKRWRQLTAMVRKIASPPTQGE